MLGTCYNDVMDKRLIQNRENLSLSILVELSKNPKGLVFIMHGLGGFKEQPHIQALTQAFQGRNFSTVRFDTTNSIGESGGKFEDATITSYYNDLEDVIAWVQQEHWYKEPFVLIGHSLGGICIGLYAEKYPHKVKALAPISPVVSGRLSVEAHERYKSEEFEEWKKTGWLTQGSVSKPGLIKRLPWSHVEDRMQYDLLPQAGKLTMPFLTIVGEHDTSTPPDQVEVLYEAVSGPKEMHVIHGAPHTFREQIHLDEIKEITNRWIEKYLMK